MNKLKIAVHWYYIWKKEGVCTTRNLISGKIDQDISWNDEKTTEYIYNKYRCKGSAVAWIS